jgi:hypothetical protein
MSPRPSRKAVGPLGSVRHHSLSLCAASARIGWAQSNDAGVLQSLQQSGAGSDSDSRGLWRRPPVAIRATRTICTITYNRIRFACRRACAACCAAALSGENPERAADRKHVGVQETAVRVQSYSRRAQSRCTCGRGEPSPGADVAGVASSITNIAGRSAPRFGRPWRSPRLPLWSRSELLFSLGAGLQVGSPQQCRDFERRCGRTCRQIAAKHGCAAVHGTARRYSMVRA